MKKFQPYKLTKQQQHILYLFYRFRFLDIAVLQQLLKHKLPTRIQSWVKDLTNKGFLYQFYDRSSFYGRTRPAVYCLTPQSKKVLQENPACEKSVLQNLYRERDRSASFQTHWRRVAQIMLIFTECYNTEDETVLFYTRNELVSYRHFPQPLPDIFIAIEKNNHTKKRYFLELLDETLSRRIIRLKLQRYFTSYQSEWSEAINNMEFPLILLVVVNPLHLRKVKKILQRVLDEEYDSLRFYVTTLEMLQSRDINKIYWEKVE